MGLLDGMGSGDIYGGLLSPQQQQAAGMRGLIATLAGIGAASGPSRLPVPMGEVMGKGALAGQQATDSGVRNALEATLLSQEAQKNQLGNQVMMARLLDVAKRHPEWFASSASPTPGSLSGTQPNPMGGLLSGAQPSPASGGIFGGGGPAAQGQTPDASAAPPVAPPSGGMQGQVAPASGPLSGGGGFNPGNMQDISDYIFLHPEMKDTIDKMLPKPVIGGERVGVPLQYYNFKSGRYEPDTSGLPAMEAAQFASARGKSQGELGAKEAAAAFEAGVKVNADNEIEKRRAFYATGVQPPNYGTPQAPPQMSQAQISPEGDIATPRGTVVPKAPPPLPFQGTDAIVKQNTNTQDTEKNFGAVRANLDGTEARLVGLADALKVVHGAGFNEKRADLANKLSGMGLSSLANIVMSEKDVAAVQKAIGLQTLDVLGQLKQINQGTGGRILNSEFVNLLDKQYGPDLKPQANFDLITQALGGVYQTKHMIDDYYQVGKPAGWGRDANAFVSSWQGKPANSMAAMIDRAGKTIGPLKGMTGADIPAPAIQHLQQNPGLADQFDAKYGPGSAKQYLGK